MVNDIPSITSVVEVADVKTSKYEWNISVSPYSKMLSNFNSIGTVISLTNVQFNKGDLASLNHSLSLNLNVQAKKADITFHLDSNNKFLQSDFLAVQGNVIKGTVPFTFTKGTLNLINDQYPWTVSIINANWDEEVDVLRFVFNIEHHRRHVVANFQDVPFKNDAELQVDRFFLSKELSDVVFVCEDENFHAHRYALACKSSVFEKMFLTDMKEKMEKSVEIKDINKKVFKAFLNFFYSGKIDETKPDSAIPLLFAADKYDVPELKELCVNFLLRNLTPENALEIYSAAETHNATNLKVRATDVIKRNKHSSIADKKALQYYINKHPDLMFELFKM